MVGRLRLLAGAGCVTLALAFAACGDDDDVGGATGGGGATTAAAEGAGVARATVDAGLKYTGGTAGTATGEPLVIGFGLQKGGTPSFDEMEAGADAAVGLINANLGGIDGRPLKLDKCFVQAEEDGQKCAAQFLNNDDVRAVVWGLTVVGGKSFYNAVAGKLPVVVSNPGAGEDYTTEHVYELDGGGASVIVSMVLDAARLNAKSVAIVSSDNPSGKFATEQLAVPELKRRGISYKVVYQPDAATTSDYTSALQAAGAGKADAVLLVPAQANACVSVYDALKQLGLGDKKVIATYSCYGDPMPEHTGGGAKNWDFMNLATNPRIDDPQTLAYKDAMKAYGDDTYTFVGNAARSFGDLLTLTRFGNELGADGFTPAAVEDKILAFRGPMYMVPGDIACTKNPDFIGVCGNSGAGSTYDGSAYTSLGAFQVVTLKP